MANWANVKEAATHLRMHPQTIYAAIKKGSALGEMFKNIKGTKQWRVDLDRLDLFLNNNEELIGAREKKAIKAWVLEYVYDVTGADELIGGSMMSEIAVNCMWEFEDKININKAWVDHYNEIADFDDIQITGTDEEIEKFTQRHKVGS